MPEAIEQELKITPSKQLQAKLTASLERKTCDQVIKQIRDTFRLGEFSIEPHGIEVIEDQYFDTHALSLYDCQASVRLRRVGSRVLYTIKKMRSHEPGQLERDEIETEVSENQARDLAESGFREAITTLFCDLDDESRLVPILTILNRRQNFLLRRRDEAYVMSVDQFRCETSLQSRNSETYFEIEIEAQNEAAAAQLSGIKRNLRGAADLAYSDLSKYERGIKDLVSGHRDVPSAVVESDAPATISSGVLRDLWSLPPRWRRAVLYTSFAIVLLSSVAYAVWSSLPESAKTHILERIGAAQPSRRAR